MSDYTFLRVDVDSDTVATVVDRIPGVAVEELAESETRESGEDGTETSAVDSAGDDVAASVEESDSGRTGRVVALAREWGLLGLGVSLIGLGVATAGLWWYRRRKGADDASDEEWETPAEDFGDESGSRTGHTGGETPPPMESDRERPVEQTDTRESGPSPTASEPSSGSENDTGIDVAPVLGLSFLVLAGAFVRWAQRAGDDETETA